MLTKRQNQLLTYLTEFLENNGYAPSYKEMAVYMNVKSAAAIHYLVKQLKDRGFVDYEPNRARTLKLVTNPVVDGVVMTDQEVEFLRRMRKQRQAAAIGKFSTEPRFYNLPYRECSESSDINEKLAN